LAAPFDKTFQRELGGQTFTYVTKEQVYSRANEVLGFAWDYDVQSSQVNADADEAVVRVRAYVIDPATGTTMHREGFGSSKIKRKRADGTILDLGNDFKAATSDAVKNALASFGIGLYRYEKDGDAVPNAGARGATTARHEAAPATGTSGLTCEDCGDALRDTKFKNGDTWSAGDLAKSGRTKYGRVLCMEHYCQAKSANGGGSAPRQSSEDLPFQCTSVPPAGLASRRGASSSRTASSTAPRSTGGES
jgi:Rad52/22 family double-strand break repair protein